MTTNDTTTVPMKPDAEIELLRKERDDARRMYCQRAARYSEYETPEEIADMLDWDCFKEETKQ
jgi:hypothetical protein